MQGRTLQNKTFGPQHVQPLCLQGSTQLKASLVTYFRAPASPSHPAITSSMLISAQRQFPCLLPPLQHHPGDMLPHKPYNPITSVHSLKRMEQEPRGSSEGSPLRVPGVPGVFGVFGVLGPGQRRPRLSGRARAFRTSPAGWRRWDPGPNFFCQLTQRARLGERNQPTRETKRDS